MFQKVNRSVYVAIRHLADLSFKQPLDSRRTLLMDWQFRRKDIWEQTAKGPFSRGRH
jgi:hypothetical protein